MMRANEELAKITNQIMDVDPKYRAKSKERGKLLPRDRVNAILDHGSPFLEISQLSGYQQLPKGASIPSANMIAGIGLVNGRQCMIVANNHSFSAGTYYPLTVKKHIRA
jgi:3-methylcrotonyl-CoA carboxylase beta subunit